MRVITDLTEVDVRGRYVLVRSSCNVPLEDGRVTNDYRLRRALPTLTWLRERGAKTILLAHIGRDEHDTLRPVFDAFSSLLPMRWGGVVGSTELATQRSQMSSGDILMVENVRQDVREQSNDPTFTAVLAELGDIYVNDAFDNVHRSHASMVGVPHHLPSYAGITLAEEVSELTNAMSPTAPSLFILGGAKFETKLPLIEKYLVNYDHVFVGGALLNDVLKADGYPVGASLVSPVSLADTEILTNPKLLRAVDVVVVRAGMRIVVLPSDVAVDDVIVDIGPQTVASLAPYVAAARTILWNGPMGRYEDVDDGGTQALARLIAEADGFSIVGGGDTVAAIEQLGILDRFGFVSIGGGAMLTFLEHGTTPALDALN